MGLVIMILGILFLCGVNCGKALAICAIITGALVFIKGIIKVINKDY
jgi:uncharacterized membrane protein HdeD (DUF308 family)